MIVGASNSARIQIVVGYIMMKAIARVVVGAMMTVPTLCVFAVFVNVITINKYYIDNSLAKIRVKIA